MNFDAYKVTSVQYPAMPHKPTLKHHPTAAEARAYADAKDEYDKQMVTHREAVKAYHIEEGRLMDQFRKDAIEEAGLTGHPKADKAFALAWQEGHASGLSDVMTHLYELAELLKD